MKLRKQTTGKRQFPCTFLRRAKRSQKIHYQNTTTSSLITYVKIGFMMEIKSMNRLSQYTLLRFSSFPRPKPLHPLRSLPCCAYAVSPNESRLSWLKLGDGWFCFSFVFCSTLLLLLRLSYATADHKIGLVINYKQNLYFGYCFMLDVAVFSSHAQRISTTVCCCILQHQPQRRATSIPSKQMYKRIFSL